MRAPRLEAHRQWIRYQAEIQVDKEKEQAQREEIKNSGR